MTFVHAVTPIAGSATPDDPQRPATVDHTPAWPLATSWIVAAAALASVLALGLWAGVLWRYLQPSAFRGSLILGRPLSVGFVLFVARAFAHALVIGGAAAGVLGWRRAARWPLLVGGTAVVAIALINFTTLTVFQSGLRIPRTGADFVVGVAVDGAPLVGTNILYLLLVWAMSHKYVDDHARPDRPTVSEVGPAPALAYSAGEPRDGRPEVAAILAAVAVNSAAQIVDLAAWTWISLEPAAFHSYGSSGGLAGWITSGVFFLGYAAVVAGAAGLLLWRRRAGRTILALGAVTVVALRIYGYARFLAAPPAGMARTHGPELIVYTIADVARIGTMLLVYALAVAAVTYLAAGLPQLRDD
jgi:hypothetical protein